MPRVAGRVEVTVMNVYGMDVDALAPKLTGRQQFVDFRTNVNVGEMFLALDGTIKTHKKATHQFGGPRLIVEDRKRRIVTYTETGEIRTPREGECWMDDNGVVNTFATNNPVAIVTRNEAFVAE